MQIETRQLLGEKYNKWLSDNARKDGNYSNTVFDFLFVTSIVVLTVEQFKQVVIDAYWGGLEGTINDYKDGEVIEGAGAERYYNELLF